MKCEICNKTFSEGDEYQIINEGTLVMNKGNINQKSKKQIALCKNHKTPTVFTIKAKKSLKEKA